MRIQGVSIVTIWGWYLQTVSYYKQETCIFIDADYIPENFTTELAWNLSNHGLETYISIFLGGGLLLFDSDIYLTWKSFSLGYSPVTL